MSAVLLGCLVALSLVLACSDGEPITPEEAAARVRVTRVPVELTRGREAYATRCGSCHGPHGE